MDTYEVTTTWTQTARFRVEAEGAPEAYLAVVLKAPGVRSMQDLGQDGELGQLLGVFKVEE